MTPAANKVAAAPATRAGPASGHLIKRTEGQTALQGRVQSLDSKGQ
jgi:hypothetical protein